MYTQCRLLWGEVIHVSFLTKHATAPCIQKHATQKYVPGKMFTLEMIINLKTCRIEQMRPTHKYQI